MKSQYHVDFKVGTSRDCWIMLFLYHLLRLTRLSWKLIRLKVVIEILLTLTTGRFLQLPYVKQKYVMAQVPGLALAPNTIYTISHVSIYNKIAKQKMCSEKDPKHPIWMQKYFKMATLLLFNLAFINSLLFFIQIRESHCNIHALEFISLSWELDWNFLSIPKFFFALPVNIYQSAVFWKFFSVDFFSRKIKKLN